MFDPIITYANLSDGTHAVYEQLDGRQYVLDDDGDKVHGVWLIPRDGDDIDLPILDQPFDDNLLSHSDK